MAVPKKRTGKAKQASRRANWKGAVPETAICSECGAAVLTHTVCTECGTYKGRKVLKTENSASSDSAAEAETEDKKDGE